VKTILYRAQNQHASAISPKFWADKPGAIQSRANSSHSCRFPIN
jgi:hypothetical protein